MAPLLEELASYTALGPKLRRRKIDVDYMVDSMDGKMVGDLIDQVGVPRSRRTRDARCLMPHLIQPHDVGCVVCDSRTRRSLSDSPRSREQATSTFKSGLKRANEPRSSTPGIGRAENHDQYQHVHVCLEARGPRQH